MRRAEVLKNGRWDWKHLHRSDMERFPGGAVPPAEATPLLARQLAFDAGVPVTDVRFVRLDTPQPPRLRTLNSFVETTQVAHGTDHRPVPSGWSQEADARLEAVASLTRALRKLDEKAYLDALSAVTEALAALISLLPKEKP